MTVGIVGLGLIGGSLARAYAEAGHKVLVYDVQESVAQFAIMAGAAAGILTDEELGNCDLILIAIYPQAAVRWLEEKAPFLKHTVIDCCGVKEEICQKGFALAEKYGFLFVGGHPMAGTHYSGFKYSRGSLFKGAPMVLVPPRRDDMQLLDEITQLLAPCKFGKFSVTTARDHDEMIAFTSQLAHVVSNAYVKSETATRQKGFSAGSYKDLTRVAWLNAPMWTELFLENKEPLLRELDQIIGALGEYRQALAQEDGEKLCQLLEDGKKRKEEVG
ncbi:MAG: prephenate dehydrogenase [Oscillospiraceae bacterium]|nr:prephenate dehydrogenase [Oscillospiraceae bacterium]